MSEDALLALASTDTMLALAAVALDRALPDDKSPASARFTRIGVCFCGDHTLHYCRECEYALPGVTIPPLPVDDGYVTLAARVPREQAEALKGVFDQHGFAAEITEEPRSGFNVMREIARRL